MTHERFNENVGAYLLGALPAGERAAFERHLEDCGECREEVATLRVAADALPHAVEPVAPPPALKASLMKAVEREAAGDAARARPPRWPAWPALRLPRMRPLAAGLAATALLATGALAGYEIGRTDGEGARTLSASVDAARVGPATARVTIPRDGDQAVLRVAGLPATGPESVYQVWLKRGDRVTSQSLFTVGADGTGAAAVPDRVEGADAVMVTREPAGGSRAPTDRPLVTVTL